MSFRGTSLIRNTPPVGPYGSPVPTVYGPMVILGGRLFLLSEIPLSGPLYKGYSR